MRTGCLLAVGIFLYLSFKGLWDSPDWLWLVLGGGGFLMLVNAGNNSDRRHDQIKRDGRAREKADALLNLPKEAPPLPGTEFILFLRPFPIDSGIRSPNPRQNSLTAWLVPFYRMAIESTCTFDDAIAYALRAQGELLAIGPAGERVGASRVAVGDDEWRAYYLSLAEHARALIFMLGMSENTLWEFEQALANPNLREKTVLLLPPTVLSLNDGLDPATLVAGRLKRMGLALPVAKSGEGFIFNEEGAIGEHAPVVASGWSTHAIKQGNLRHLVSVAASPRPHPGVLPASLPSIDSIAPPHPGTPPPQSEGH